MARMAGFAEPKFDWDRLQADYDRLGTFRAVAEEWGTSEQYISRMARKLGVRNTLRDGPGTPQRGRNGRYQPLWLTPYRDRRYRALKESRGMSLGQIMALGFGAVTDRRGDPAEELCLRVSRKLIDEVVTMTTTDKRRMTSVWFSIANEERWRALHESEGFTLTDIFDLGLDAAEDKFGGYEAAFRLQVARELRELLHESGKLPYADAAAQREKIRAYLANPNPAGAEVPVLLAGRKPRGVRKPKPPQ